MKLPAIAGPTGCGKTLLALAVAEQLNGEIISVDSGAVYRDMNIGTATPTTAMCARVRHHLVNIVDPTQTYHVGRFVADVQSAVKDIIARQKTPLLVGGSMMYFHILQTGLSAIPPIPPEIFAAVNEEIKDMPAAQAALAAVDAPTAARISVGDRQRLHRALAVYRATQKPLSAWLRDAPPTPPVQLQLVRLIPADRALLRHRLAQRLEEMWAAGLVEETQHLLQHWRLSADHTPLQLIGYRQAVAHCQGEITAEAMRAEAYTATCQLAKRQITWLKRWTTAATLDPMDSGMDKKLMAAFDSGVV